MVDTVAHGDASCPGGVHEQQHVLVAQQPAGGLLLGVSINKIK